MAEERKNLDRKRSACKKELNKFYDMSLKQKASMDVEDEEFWNFKNIVINC